MSRAILVFFGMVVVGLGLLATSYWWLGLILLLAAGWNAYMQVAARRQINLIAPVAAADVVVIVGNVFGGKTWNLRTVNGTDFEATNRLKVRGPTFAVHLEDRGNSTAVSVWLSNGNSRYGLVEHAQFAWRKMHALTAAISASADTPAAGRS